jgi:predicted transcriptional regulator
MPSAFKELLDNIAGEKAPGPSATFSVFHIYTALQLMAEKPIGRSKLASGLNVGEGVIRTIIGRLKDAGLIITSKKGCKLTSKGLKVWKDAESVFRKKVELGENELSLGKYNFAFLVKNHGDKVRSGLEQRDASVVAGAKGATAIVCKTGNLIIASVSGTAAKDYPEIAGQISKLGLEDNDAIIVASADTLLKAKQGAFAAAWTLLNDC